MIGGKTNSATKPTALGTMLNASTYGATKPTIIGTTRSSLLAIWAAHLRNGHSGKKGKKGKGPPTYVENINFLVGSNPIEGCLQVWTNNTNRYTMDFVKVDASGIGTGNAPFPWMNSFPIVDSHFYFLMALTVDVVLSGTFSDYGDPASAGGILSYDISLSSPGSGYAVNDEFSVNIGLFPSEGTIAAVGHITSVSAGVPTGIVIDIPGAGYAAPSFNVPTTTLTGAGTGMAISIETVGKRSYSQTSERPMWNLAQHGPNIVQPNMLNLYPYTYYWAPATGNVVFLPSYNNVPTFGLKYHAYYMRLTKASAFMPPIQYNRMAFEQVLGSGPEYANAGLSAQQDLHPCDAGLGSSDIDLGTTGMIPDFRVEVKGSHCIHPHGDADFVDMIQDTMMSGVAQTLTQLGLIQRGLNCNDLPGPVQRYFDGTLEPNTPLNLVFAQPNAVGGLLIAYMRWRFSAGSNPTISSAPVVDTWTTQMISPAMILATATSTGAAAGNIVSGVFNGGGFAFDSRGYLFEMAPGSNQVLNTSVLQGANGGAPAPLTISITVPQGCYLLLIGECQGYDASLIPPHWENIASPLDPFGQPVLVMQRVVAAAGTYSFTLNDQTGSYNLTILALGGPPSPLPKALGDIIEHPSLELTRAQCHVSGLIGAITMNSQRPGSDWLKEFYQCANAAPVWSGDVLKTIPMSEVSEAGNGTVYISPTASGPVATLTVNDLVADKDKSPVTIKRSAQVDADNIDQLEFCDRGNDYNTSTASQPESAAITFAGPRKLSPTLLHEIQDPAVARKILAISVRRKTHLRNSYVFTAMQKWIGLEAMDLIRIPDPNDFSVYIDVRLTKVSENDNLELECEAEPFLYGLNAPDDLAVTAVVPNNLNAQYIPGPVNPPVILEPPLRMSSSGAAELWFVVSDSDPQYGGCTVYVSVDGGTSYVALNPVIRGNGTTGYVTADWPASADPDAVNALSVDLTESFGALPSYTADEENAFLFPSFVATSPTPTPSFNSGSSNYGGLEPSQAVSYTLTGAALNILVCNTRSSGMSVWFNPKIGSGVTRFITDITSTCGGNPGGFLIDTPGTNCSNLLACAEGCSPLGPCVSDPLPHGCIGFNPNSRPGDIASAPASFSYDMENMVVGIDNAGKIIGISNSNALNEATFNLAGWGTTPDIYIFEIAPVTPGNPHLYVAIIYGGPGPTPSGWTKVVTGANVFSALTFVGTAVDPPGSNYELMTYQAANLTSAYHYTMPASAPAPLRRAVFGMPLIGQGEDHAIASRFAWLDAWQSNPTPQGILKVKLDPTWINQVLNFKFVPFNSLLGGFGDLAIATPYQYTPVGPQPGGGTTGGGTGSPGSPGQTTYQITGGALTNPTATTIAMEKAFVTFSTGNAVYYNARTLTIPAPIVPTTYFVTIFDPSLLGDTGSSTALAAQASLTQQFVGLPGYIYIGSIQVLPGGGGGVTTPGGWPPAEQILVNGI